MHFYAALEEKESNQQGGLVAYLLWPEQRKGWPFCLPEQLVNSDSRAEERQCQAPQAGTMECRHAIDQGGGCWQSGAVGWKGHGLPSAEEATKDSPCLVLLHFLSALYPGEQGGGFVGSSVPLNSLYFLSLQVQPWKCQAPWGWRGAALLTVHTVLDQCFAGENTHIPPYEHSVSSSHCQKWAYEIIIL